MIEEVGTVTAVDEKHIWVETQVKSTCGACEANQDCGTGTIAKAFAPKTEQLVLPRTCDVQVGQEVKLGIPERHLLLASAVMYLLPLVVMILVATASSLLLPRLGLTGELWVVGAAFAATALSYILIKRLLGQGGKQAFTPALLGVYPTADKRIPVTQITPQSGS